MTNKATTAGMGGLIGPLLTVSKTGSGRRLTEMGVLFGQNRIQGLLAILKLKLWLLFHLIGNLYD